MGDNLCSAIIGESIYKGELSSAIYSLIALFIEQNRNNCSRDCVSCSVQENKTPLIHATAAVFLLAKLTSIKMARFGYKLFIDRRGELIPTVEILSLQANGKLWNDAFVLFQ